MSRTTQAALDRALRPRPQLAHSEARRGIAAFMHKEVFDLKKLRRDANILPWPKNRAKTPAICLFRDLIIAKACYRDPLIDSTTQGSVRKFSPGLSPKPIERRRKTNDTNDRARKFLHRRQTVLDPEVTIYYA
jgi:hypothetical protein